jgi:aryl-alcohol dehydrogenase-like predicted oxidoreductase
LAIGQKIGAKVRNPLRWAPLTGKIRRNAPIPAGSSLHETAPFGPPVNEEQMYSVIEALEQISEETNHTVPQVAIN